MDCRTEHLGRRWASHKKMWAMCDCCGLSKYAMTRVLGRGQLPAHVFFLGEGPGRSEDACGEPFIGRSGKLLDIWVEYAQNAGTPFTFAMGNLVACRPTDRIGGPNRPPNGVEMKRCHEQWLSLMGLVNPQLIVTLGKSATTRFADQHTGRDTIELPHPAFILRIGGIQSPRHEQSMRMLRDGIDQYVL